MLNESTVVSRSESILATDLDDEVMMMSIEHGEYYALESVGARIWHLLEQPATLESLCQQLVSEFDVDLETCMQDVRAFISRLKELEVIQIS